MRILAFGIAKEIIGASTAELPIAENISVRELKARLQQHFPRFSQLAACYRIAVNNEFASEEASIHPQDEIAIIPPVSGG